MEWPIKEGGARLLKVWTDEVASELYMVAVFDEKIEQDIVYEDIFCQQFTPNSVGLVITSVKKISLEDLKRPEYAQAAARFCDALGAEGPDNHLLRAICARGNSLFAHRTEDGGEYLVLARRVCFDESRPYGGGLDLLVTEKSG